MSLTPNAAAAEKQDTANGNGTPTRPANNATAAGSGQQRYGGVMHARHPFEETVAFVVPRVDVRWVLERAKDGTVGDRPLGAKSITTRNEYSLCPSCLPADDPACVAECPNRAPVPPAPFDEYPDEADGPSAEIWAEARGSRCPYMHVVPARLQRYEAHLRTRAERYERLCATAGDPEADITVAVGRAMVTTGGAFVDWVPLSAILKTRAMNVVVDSPQQARAQAIEDARTVTAYLENGAPDGPALKEGRSIGMHCAHWATHGVCAYGETCYFVHAMTFSETTSQHFRDRYNKKDRRKPLALADEASGANPLPIAPAGEEAGVAVVNTDGASPPNQQQGGYFGPESDDDDLTPGQRKKRRKKAAKAAAAAELAAINRATYEAQLEEQRQQCAVSPSGQVQPQLQHDTSRIVPLAPPPQYQSVHQAQRLPGPPLSPPQQPTWQPAQPPPPPAVPAPRSAMAHHHQAAAPTPLPMPDGHLLHLQHAGYPSEETRRYEQHLLMQHQQQQHVRRAFAQQFQQSLAAHQHYAGHLGHPHPHHHNHPPPFQAQRQQQHHHHQHHSPVQPPQHHQHHQHYQQQQQQQQLNRFDGAQGFHDSPQQQPAATAAQVQLPAGATHVEHPQPHAASQPPLMPPRPVDAPPMPPMAI